MELRLRIQARIDGLPPKLRNKITDGLPPLATASNEEVGQYISRMADAGVIDDRSTLEVIANDHWNRQAS